MSLADRLRGVVRVEPAKAGPHDNPAGPHENERPQDHPNGRGGRPQPAHPDAAETLGGEWSAAGGHRFLVIDRKYAPGHRLGRVAVADCLPADDGLWPRLWLLVGAEAPALQEKWGDPALQANAPTRLLFVDLETTGLAGGADTCAFLVGCGWFEGASFRIRQFFLAGPGAERAMLDAVAEAAATAGGVVTYNGKSFDLPLIETRFLFHRMETPFAGMPHVDMLHPARRLWRPERDDAGAPACRLSTLEEALLGHVREDDVPGFEIPSRYFQYVRTSDARPLHAVMEHNRLDLLALAMITARAAQLLEDGPAAARTAREALGLGRLYERGGLIAEARASYAQAAGLTHEPAKAGPHVDAGHHVDAGTRAEALQAYAVLSRRERRYEDAAAAWRRAIEIRPCPAHIAREAAEALAVHHEHRARDLQAARRFALKTLQFNVSVARTQAVQHRLARLDRKLSVPTAESAQLF